jgi:hypothetical protein
MCAFTTRRAFESGTTNYLALQTRHVHATRAWLDPSPLEIGLFEETARFSVQCPSLLQPTETTSTFAAKSAGSIQATAYADDATASEFMRNPTGSAERGRIVLPSGFSLLVIDEQRRSLRYGFGA